MTPATRVLHGMLIRFAKGAIKAWETWVRDSTDASPSIEIPPRDGRTLEAVRGALNGKDRD
jgi:hypothetical protein